MDKLFDAGGPCVRISLNCSTIFYIFAISTIIGIFTIAAQPSSVLELTQIYNCKRVPICVGVNSVMVVTQPCSKCQQQAYVDLNLLRSSFKFFRSNKDLSRGVNSDLIRIHKSWFSLGLNHLSWFNFLQRIGLRPD